MELEEMKTLWTEMSVEMEKQKKLTDSLIIRMTRSDYRNKINKILLPEAAGTLVCFGMILFVLINFQKLHPWYLQVCGIAGVIILLAMPVLSIKAIFKMRSINISGNNFRQSLLEYSNGKMQFLYAQKAGIYLGAILAVVILPVMGQLIAGKDIFKTTGLWLGYAVAFPFFYWFARWGFKGYLNLTKDAENILKELEC